MAKIEIITPVHVGTGTRIEAPAFQQKGDTVDRFSFADVLSSMPEQYLTNPTMLKVLSSENPNKESMYNAVRKGARYDQIRPLYTAAWNQNFLLIKECRDVNEQVKDLGVPYIPGSTLKGALEQAFKYWLLKKHYSDVERNLEWYLSRFVKIIPGEDSKRTKKKAGEGFVLELIDRTDEKTANNFFKKLYSCLLVKDIYFDEIEICKSQRGFDKNWEYNECICPGQSASAKNIVQIDEKKLKKIGNDPALTDMMKSILKDLTMENLARATQEYLNDTINCEGWDYAIENYADVCKDDEVNQFVRKMWEVLDQPNNGSTMWMRVGKYCGYFYKTVTWLFQQNSYSLYYDYFDFAFSPVSPKKSEELDPGKFPSTRTLFSNKDGCWLPGFIKVSL